MITRILNALLIAAPLSAFPAMAAHHEGSHAKQDKKEQATCPVSGREINKEVYVDHEGSRIYLCCAGCKDKAKADAAMIIADYRAEGVALAKVDSKQTLCPVMGGEIDRGLYSDYKGKRVYLCCAMCRPKFEENAAKYIKEMEARGIKLEKVAQSG
jgi:YHS domain-containing protein